MIGEQKARELARYHRVALEVVCTTCGKPSYAAAHEGHMVTRLAGADAGRRPNTTVAPRVRVVPAVATEPPLTVYDVAAELGVSKMTVYRLCHSGEMAHMKIGRSFRISRAALDAYLGRARQAGPR